MKTTLKRLEDTINKDLDVKVLPGLKQITSDQASLIKNVQDGERFSGLYILIMPEKNRLEEICYRFQLKQTFL